jgi:transposase
MKLYEIMCITSEKEIIRLLQEQNIFIKYDKCISCNAIKIGYISRNRVKCYKCKKEWNLKMGSVIESSKIDLKKFLLLVKLFQLGFTSKDTAKELTIDIKVVYQMFDLIRMRISGLSQNNLNQMDYLLKGEDTTFGIKYNKGKIKISLVENMEENHDSLFQIKRTRIPNSYASYDLTYNRKINIIKLGKGMGYFSELDRFWRFAKEFLIKFRGTTYKGLYALLKEIEFRYNQKDSDIFLQIMRKMKVVEKGGVL